MPTSSRALAWSAIMAFLLIACGERRGTDSAAPCRATAGPLAAYQGRIEETGIPTDVALYGPGFFVLEGEGPDSYTRLGRFTVAPDGLLVSLDGRPVLGWPSGAATPQPLAVGTAFWPAIATHTIHLAGQLQRGVGLAPMNFDPQDPASTSDFSTASAAYDRTGNIHALQVYFVWTGSSGWDWHVLADGSSVLPGIPGTAVEVAAGRLAFDGAGRLVSAQQFPEPTFVPVGQQQPQPLRFDLGDPLDEPGGTGLRGFTEGPISVTTFVGQDGMPSGELVSTEILSDGWLVSTFSNGERDLLGQLAVATFPNPAGLSPYPGDTYAATQLSGPPRLARAGSPGVAVTMGGALERQPAGATCEAVGP